MLRHAVPPLPPFDLVPLEELSPAFHDLPGEDLFPDPFFTFFAAAKNETRRAVVRRHERCYPAVV